MKRRDGGHSHHRSLIALKIPIPTNTPACPSSTSSHPASKSLMSNADVATDKAAHRKPWLGPPLFASALPAPKKVKAHTNANIQLGCRKIIDLD